MSQPNTPDANPNPDDNTPLTGDADDQILLGHKYDGIREYDNPMPGWWLGIFALTIVWAAVYFFGIEVFGFVNTYEDDLAASQQELASMREAYAASNPSFETDPAALAAYADDPAMAEAGAGPYAAMCAACHGDQGQGLIGPNLADPYWIHGGSPEAVYTVIREGVPAQGMPAWDGALSAEEQAQVMAFVLSLQGTDPPNPKEPQGDLVEPM